MGRYSADVIVVGGGVMGCASAYQLAKDGQRVLLLEQYTIGNRQGSSHGAARLFRLAHDSTDYVELARAARLFWSELEDESGEQILRQVYGLDFGSPPALEGLQRTLQAASVPFERLDRQAMMKRFPHFEQPKGQSEGLPEDTIGLYQPDYALIAAERCVGALARLARRHAAEFVECQAVHSIRPTGDSVEVRTSEATYQAGRVVLCAGSWMGPMAQQLGLDLPLRIRKEHITYYLPDDPLMWMPGVFPIFRHHLSGTDARWGVGFPIFEHRGVKMILDCTGPFVEPEDPDREVDQTVLDRVRSYIAGIVPTLGGDIVEAETCRYTMTPDEDFILDHHPAYPQIVIASPCSGHGFKFAPLIGRILADLALRGKTAYDIERFRLDRPALRKQTG